MSGRYLLDSNILIELFRGNASVQERLDSEAQIFVSVVALGELYHGAGKSQKKDRNLAQVDAFASRVSILSCDHETARSYGGVKSRLEKRGQRIPENDIWIAATALQHGLTLATRDAHFGAVEGLAREEW